MIFPEAGGAARVLPPVPVRYEGSPGSVQGGYLAGLAAQQLVTADSMASVRVQIRRPVKPGDTLRLEVAQPETGQSATGTNNDTDQVRRLSVDGELTLVAFQDAVRAEPPAVRLDRHLAVADTALPLPKPFPSCVGCGDRSDSLGVVILPGQHRMVATWTSGQAPAASLMLDVWTMTDCFTSWALYIDPPADASGTYVTGNIALDIRRPFRAGVSYRMQSWRVTDVEPGLFRHGSVIVGGAIEDDDGLVALADQELVRTFPEAGGGMTLETAPWPNIVDA